MVEGYSVKEEPRMANEQTKRLDRVLGNMGVGTRKEIKLMAKKGRITINGSVVKDSGVHINTDSDVVEVDGVRVQYREYIYLLMNKPAGLVSATEDAREETVVSLLEPEDAVFDVFPVGRLDKDTEGLLVLTNDGRLAHEVLSPKHHVPKTYYARIQGVVNNENVKAFSAGIELEDGYVCLPGDLTILGQENGSSEIELTIYEGKFHQVKRMFEAVGKPVTYLKRIRMGNLTLDDNLVPGTYREMDEEDLSLLRQLLAPLDTPETGDD